VRKQGLLKSPSPSRTAAAQLVDGRTRSETWMRRAGQPSAMIAYRRKTLDGRMGSHLLCS
jgi:hypothetical protein